MDKESDLKIKEKLISNIFSFITDESNEFVVNEELYVQGKSAYYRKYTSKIGLEAILPRYNHPLTECVIYFKILKARDCMLILDNKLVVTQLFKGIYSDPKYGGRGFLRSNNKNKSTENIFDLDNAHIEIGNTRLKISKDDIYLLCEVIDSYANNYINSIRLIEDVLKTQKYPLSKKINNYKLLYLTYQEWEKLLKFSVKHDVDKGIGNWYIFDKNRHYIKIYTKNHERYGEGYHAFFHAEHFEDIVYYPSLTSKDICITFEFIEDFEHIDDELLGEKFHWNAEIAYNWFTNEFIPKVLGKKKYNKDSKKDKDTEMIFFGRNIEKVIYLDELQIDNYNSLIEIIELLQSHFHSNPHNIYRIKKENLQGVYQSILLCLSKAKEIDLYYVCGKLNVNICETIDELIESITEIKNRISDETINGFGIDLLFRALVIIMRYNDNLSINEINSLRIYIDYFVKQHDLEVLLEKYSIDFIN
ncbi:hypothetical protein [Peribacillus acanthi]|uniref:hypothetical protein n=1 Tax=Peribacillus acanthi TaxID=2171554 RepID=UPI00130025B3|nr:hypothetical protein [Peribacillus acanthi]